MHVRIIGRGRAGQSFAGALADRCEVEVLGRGDHRHAAADVDAVLLAVPDRSIAEVAASIEPGVAALLHCSGATTLDSLAPHRRRGSVHPLTSMSDGESGARRLRGAWMAISGDEAAAQLAALLEARTFAVADNQRVLYHATAAIAANHVTAVLASVERLAASIGVPMEAFAELARGAVDNVAAVGATRALTGPVARGDWATVRRHLDQLPDRERDLYVAAAAAAADLVDRVLPPDVY